MPDERRVSIYVAAAIAGCFKRESGVNPGIWESLIVPSDTWFHVYRFDGIGGYGFGQFTNVPFGTEVSWRARDYYLWCVNSLLLPGDGSAQIRYITEVERVWFSASSVMGYRTIDEFLQSDSTDLDRLTEEWLACWEGVPGDNLAERQEAARAFFDYIREHENDDISDLRWFSENTYLGYLSQDQLNNVLLLYHALNGYDPGGDPDDPTKKKKKPMPIWFMLRPRRY